MAPQRGFNDGAGNVWNRAITINNPFLARVKKAAETHNSPKADPYRQQIIGVAPQNVDGSGSKQGPDFRDFLTKSLREQMERSPSASAFDLNGSNKQGTNLIREFSDIKPAFFNTSLTDAFTANDMYQRRNKTGKYKDLPASSTTGTDIDMTGADANGSRGLEGTYAWDDQINAAAKQYGVPPEVIRAIMGIESGGDAGVVSVAGAMGLMQVMPFHYANGENGMDPVTSINKGTQILADNYARFGSWDLAAAAYLGAIGQDDAGNWVVTSAPDAYGTTGHDYVQLFRNNLAAQGWGQSGGGQVDYNGSFGNGAVQAAETLLGLPYVWGGDSHSEGGFDCSGLTQFAYQQMGVTIPRTAQDQYNGASRFSDPSQLQVGDLIFYGSGPGGVTHVAIYAGNGYIIDAPSEGKTIRKIPMNTPWYQQNTIGFGRYATGDSGYATGNEQGFTA